MKNQVLGVCALLALGCAGADGAAGERGPRGKSGDDGESAVLSSREADEDECSEGGYVLTVGVGDDTDDIVVCHGERGPAGDAGPQGPAGQNGEDAAPSIGAIEGTIYCGASLENTSMSFGYWALVFGDGSVYARANITNGVNDSSGSLLYAPWQVGALTAAITVTFDVQGPTVGGWWQIELNRETLVVEITYNDVDVEGGELTWTLEPNENNCVVTDRDD